MPRFKPSRLECSLFLFPCVLLLLTQLDKFRALDGQSLSMTFNPLRRLTENRRTRSCQANLKQLSLGLTMYLQDYDERFPNSTTASSWASELVPYGLYGDDSLFHCPTTSGRAFRIPAYWMNGNLNDKRGRGVFLRTVIDPARTFAFGDGPENSVAPFTLNENNWNARAIYARRHLFGSNYVFVDGHVKWLSSEEANAIRFKSPHDSLYSWKLK